MTTNVELSVFNLNAALIGLAGLLICFFVQVLTVNVAIRVMLPKITFSVSKMWKIFPRVIFFSSVLMLLCSHLVQIFLWSYLLFITGIIQNLGKAFVFAGSIYSTVGFSTDPLTEQWQLITVIMAASGLFTFGWSTSIIFMLAQKITPLDK